MTSHASSLHAFLNKTQKRPTRTLSQNFLIDSNIVRKLVGVADVTSQDIILEIGPGTGAITKVLLETGAKVIAIEKDTLLADQLRNELSSKRLHIIQGDILDLDLNSILPKSQKVKVISNLPFKITSPIFGKFFPLHEQISTLTFIIQKDIVDRIRAKHNTKAFSSLTLFTQFYTRILKSFDISSNCYFPKPNVKTSALVFELKKPLLEDPSSFFKLVRSAFMHRRKMISSSLEIPTQEVRDSLEALNLPPLARPENLDLENWLKFYHCFEDDLKT